MYPLKVHLNCLYYFVGISFPVIFGILVYTSCVQNAYSQKDTQSETKMVGNSPLIEKIQAVKEQIQVQGNTNRDEDYSLNLLLKVVKGKDLDQSLLYEVQSFISSKNKTPLMEKVSDLLNQIQVQGEVTQDEDRALKNLLVLTSDNGFNDPFFDDVLKDVEVPFAVIDEVPIYPGCESLTTNNERKQCMSDEIAKFVNKNFNTSIADSLGLIGRQRINVIFKIGNDGSISEIKSRAPHPALEEEAIRIIKELPKMIPGKQKGRAVTVPYSLPIVFVVDK